MQATDHHESQSAATMGAAWLYRRWDGRAGFGLAALAPSVLDSATVDLSNARMMWLIWAIHAFKTAALPPLTTTAL